MLGSDLLGNMEHIKVVGVFFIAILHISFGNHYRGGSISWKPIGDNQIELNYQVGFKLDFEDPGFEPCTPEARYYRTELHTSGKIRCDSCDENEAVKQLRWICDDYDVTGDSALGHNSLIYNIPSGKQEIDIRYEDCCWIDLQSPVDRYGGARGWKMLAHVDMQPRPDNGLINSSPVSSPMPLERYYKGCEYSLRIRVSDPDGDAIRCRYADKSKGECPRNGITMACGPPTDGVTINKKYCTMDVNTQDVSEGYHAVNVIIEDYIRPWKKKSQPLSKTSLQFLLLIEGGDEECIKPKIIDPPSCEAVRPGEHFELIIRAEAGSPSKPISRISTQKPFGMTSSTLENDPDVPGRKQVTLSWDPTVEDMGEHSLCFSALDIERFTSGTSCTFIYVDDNPLQVYPEGSFPSINEEVDAGKPLIVQFNKKIKRPKMSALIQILDVNSGEIVYEIDSKRPTVIFGDTWIEVTPPKEALFNDESVREKEFEIIINEGVAVPRGNGCASIAAQWPMMVKNVDSEPPILSGMPQNILQQTDPGSKSATVTWLNPTASDNSGSVAVTSSHTSGDSFPIGDTLVTYTATDSSGNSITANFTVTVIDLESPKIAGLPLPIFQSTDLGKDTATVTWREITATDNSGSVLLSSSHNSGDSFPIGDTIVTYIAVDPSGNEATKSFVVTITDEENPTFSDVPESIRLPKDPFSDETTIFWLPPTALDNSGSVTVSSTHAPGDSFPIGETVVTYNAVDPYSNEATVSFTVTIEDKETPTFIDVPNNIHESTDPGSDTATVFWVEPTGLDNSGSVKVSSNFQPGDSFPVGESVVTYTAVDPYDNEATISFTITIEDTEDPTIEPPPDDIIRKTDPGSDQAVVFWLEPTANDNSGSVKLSSSHQPGDSFPVGDHVVTYKAVDPYGNEATVSFVITVQDLEPPIISDTPLNIVQYADVDSMATVNWTEPIASDNSGSVTITSSHQPGDVFEIGNTTVTYTAEDLYGNTATTSFVVTVLEALPAKVPEPATWILEHPQPFQCSSVAFNFNVPYHVAQDGDECFVHLEDSHVTVSNGRVIINAQICCRGTCQTAPVPGLEVN